MYRFLLILLLSAATGYLSLSQEIIWVRVISFVTLGSPDVFAYVLGFFLFGIAFGALISKWVSQREDFNSYSFIAVMLVCASLVYFLSLPGIATLGTILGKTSVVLLLISVGITALLIGGIFPLLCHLAISSDSAVGERLSWIYLANIVGAVTGPLLTGFVFLDYWSLEIIVLVICLATLLLAVTIALFAPILARTRSLILSVSIGSILAMSISHEYLYSELFEKLQYREKFANKAPFKHIVQNRSGIITIEEDVDGDIIFGGGSYDGRFNIDPVINSNGITRAYMVSSLHPEPSEVLMIGLSSGSWARVLSDYTAIQNLSVVEINPGYIEAVEQYPEIATILEDEKVKLYTDDGRRWLNRNPERRFDFIVMNTTQHWRSNVTNLLSVEFLHLLKSHLKPGGAIYLNSTWSPDVIYTTAQVFRHTTRYTNFVAASDSPFSLSNTQRLENIKKFEHNGVPVFAPENLQTWPIALQMASSSLRDVEFEGDSEKKHWLITDDNMATEFKNPQIKKRLRLDSSRKWSRLISRIEK